MFHHSCPPSQVLNTRMTQLVDFLQGQIPLQQLQQAAQQIHRVAQVQLIKPHGVYGRNCAMWDVGH